MLIELTIPSSFLNFSVIALDLHDAQYQGFFDIAFDNLYARRLLMRYIQRNIPDYKDAIVVSPDAGGAKRATVIADSLGLDFALIHKVSKHKASHRVSRESHGLIGRACIDSSSHD